MNYREESLKKHAEWKGKIETVCRVPVDSREALSLAYTPGVAEPCMAIHSDVEKSFELTRRWNTVAVITDGTAILGLGDIGPEAGMPVMEGKCALFKAYGGVDAFPICIKSKDPDEIVKTIELISGSFGGIDLEDISAPRCFEVETRLKSSLDIPVFHDDQHGTAIVVLAALINSLKLVKKQKQDLKVVINGAGAAQPRAFKGQACRRNEGSGRIYRRFRAQLRDQGDGILDGGQGNCVHLRQPRARNSAGGRA